MSKDIPSLQRRVELLGGYSGQDFFSQGASYALTVKGDTITPASVYKTQNTLVSFFGRANYRLMDRYLLTFTLRQDGSSRFNEDKRWGLFPSAAFAWKISEEGFMKGSGVFSDLKLRLGYGITGQQDIGLDFPYLAAFTPGQSTAAYQFGSSFVLPLRPDGYDSNIKWETTATTNLGLDFGFADNRISGSLDFFQKKTKDLLSVVPVAQGSNFDSS